MILSSLILRGAFFSQRHVFLLLASVRFPGAFSGVEATPGKITWAPQPCSCPRFNPSAWKHTHGACGVALLSFRSQSLNKKRKCTVRQNRIACTSIPLSSLSDSYFTESGSRNFQPIGCDSNSNSEARHVPSRRSRPNLLCLGILLPSGRLIRRLPPAYTDSDPTLPTQLQLTPHAHGQHYFFTPM